MANPTKILSDEHKNILKVAEALNKECQSLESGKKLDKTFFEKAIYFIRNYADKFHHAKEEDILFKELCKDTVELHCNPVEQMLYEHNLGRDFIKELEKGLEKSDQAKVVENARGYAQLIGEHIFKEDNILYPMADQVLSQQTQELILTEFKQAEDKKFSPAEKEKYLTIVKELENDN